MDRNIKLIWDFRGQDAFEMAGHHCIHLNEFSEINNLPFIKVDVLKVNELYSTAYVIIRESSLSVCKKMLKPHRGVIL